MGLILFGSPRIGLFTGCLYSKCFASVQVLCKRVCALGCVSVHVCRVG
jgi:hypothetical protein